MLSLDAFESNSDTGWNPDVIEATLDCPSVYYINCKFNRKGTMLAVGGSKGECVM